MTREISCQDFEKVDVGVGSIIAVDDFPKKQIANFMSEVLTLGVPDTQGKIILLRPDADVELGARMF